MAARSRSDRRHAIVAHAGASLAMAGEELWPEDGDAGFDEDSVERTVMARG